MVKKYRALACFLLAAVFLCACATPVEKPSAYQTALSDVQRIYKSSTLVVMAECLYSHLNSEGKACFDVKITDVLAGNAKVGDILHCAFGAMAKGETYLLYLTQNSSAHHTEDEHPYSLVSKQPYKVTDEHAKIGDVMLHIDEITSSMAEANRTIASHATTFFYTNLKEIVHAADDIFIGKVISVPDFTSQKFRAQSMNTTIENTMMASQVSIEAYGVIKGELNYGDIVSYIYSPAMGANMINASTLKAESFTFDETPLLIEGEVYIFFLSNGPDAKQPTHFPINPVQGFILLDEMDNIFVPRVNVALQGHDELNALVLHLKQYTRN